MSRFGVFLIDVGSCSMGPFDLILLSLILSHYFNNKNAGLHSVYLIDQSWPFYLLSIFYCPFLNPIIYSLRNNAMKTGLDNWLTRKLWQRRISLSSSKNRGIFLLNICISTGWIWLISSVNLQDYLDPWWWCLVNLQ